MATGMRTEFLGSRQIRRTYERSTGETLSVDAPLVFKDDFINPVSATVSGLTETETVAGVTLPADVGGGILRFLTTSASSDQVAAVQYAERFNVGVASATKYAQVEFRARLSSASSFAGHQAFLGLMGTIPTLSGTGVWTEADHHVGFILGDLTETLADSLDVGISADDAVTDLTPVDAGVDFSTLATTAVWKIYRIDFSDLTNIKFYVDGVRVAPNSTVVFAGTTEAISSMAITAGLLKHTTEGDGLVATLDVDKVMAWAIR